MVSWLQKQAQEQPNKLAFFWKEEQWTFAEIYTEVQQWQEMYASVISPNEKRVALFSQNSKEMYFSILALWELGKELVLLNTHLSLKEINYQLRDAQVNQVVVSVGEMLFLSELKAVGIIAMTLSFESNTRGSFESISYEATSIASIMYTSGTTGKPKGVLQLFDNHLASALTTKESMGLTEEDCWLCAVPMFHISGLSTIIRQLVIGCSLRLYEKFNQQQLTNDLVAGKGTVISVVSMMLESLLAYYPTTGYSQVFRMMLLGGGPVSLKTLNECNLRGISVIQSYGMTETCSQVVALSSEKSLAKIGSAGKPLAGIEIKIIDNDNLTCPPNQIGEIALKGKNIAKHYLNEDKKSFKLQNLDGWFATGDLGYLDEEGFLYVVSRLSELIISGGENIYPAEVEHVIQEINGVKEVAVVGEPDKKWGLIPVAYITREEPLTAVEIQQIANQSLAKYKVPAKIYFCHSLPRTASGKLAKQQLTTMEREAFLER